MGIAAERESAFAAFAAQAWPFQFRVELAINELHGGTPRNPDVVRNWLMSKAGYDDEAEIAAELRRIFAMSADEAAEKTDAEIAEAATKGLADRHVNGFKRDSEGLYMEGRHLKSCLKEAVSVARAADKLAGKYGTTGKGIISFAAEHIFVPEDRLYLGRKEHDELQTRFTKNWRGQSSITVEEVIFDAKISTTVKSDYDFTPQEWGMIWLTAESQGIGASRSQGYGTFVVTSWEKLEDPKPEKIRSKRAGSTNLNSRNLR